MAFLGALWIPILVSAVFVFIVSTLAHTVLPHHRTEFSPAPGTDAIQAALREAAPGRYGFPMAPDPKDRMRPEWMKRFAEGPAGWITVMPRGSLSMPRNLGLSLLLNLVVSFFAAYVVWHAFAGVFPGYRTVFRIVGTVGFMTYALGSVYDSIWYGTPWRSWVLNAIDALLMGLVMGGTFGWLWPH